MAIVWTKEWSGSDDGTVLRGVDLMNIQDDLAVVVTTDDVLSLPDQTQGDIIYFDGTIWTRLPAGTDGQVLLTKGAAADPEWGEGTDLAMTGQVEGDILYFDGTNWVVIPPGTAGQVLTSNGAGTSPTYQSPSNATILFNWFKPLGYNGSTPEGTFMSTSLTASSGHTYDYYGKSFSGTGGSFRTFGEDQAPTGRMYLPNGVTTAKIISCVWAGALAVNFTFRVDIGAVQDDNVIPTSTTPTYMTEYEIDISSLTNDAYYDVDVGGRWTDAGGANLRLLYMSQFTIIGT